MAKLARVAVIGGGPAGSAAALALTREGIAASIFERYGANRDKPCGDALVKDAIPELEIFGFDQPAQLDGSNVYSTILESSEGERWTKHNRDQCWIAPRANMDQQLRDQCAANDVEVHYRTRVLTVEKSAGGGVSISVRAKNEFSQYEFDGAVLACGAVGDLSSSWGIHGQPWKVPAVSRYSAGSGADGLLFKFAPERYGRGYFWDFPLGGEGRNLGLFSLDKRSLRDAMDRCDDELRTMSDYSSTTSAKWRGAYEPLWSGKVNQWHVDSVPILSCGDAAGLVDPLTGEGIGAALLSGRLAGTALAKRLGGESQATREYSQQIDDWTSSTYNRTSERRLLRKQLNEYGVVH